MKKCFKEYSVNTTSPKMKENTKDSAKVNLFVLSSFIIHLMHKKVRIVAFGPLIIKHYSVFLKMSINIVS